MNEPILVRPRLIELTLFLNEGDAKISVNPLHICYFFETGGFTRLQMVTGVINVRESYDEVQALIGCVTS